MAQALTCAKILYERLLTGNISGLRRELPPQAAQEDPDCLYRSLTGLSLHKSRHSDKYLVPLVEPSKDGVPLAVALELTAASQPCSSGVAAVPVEEADSELADCFALRYVLDGQAQVCWPLSAYQTTT